MEISDGLRFPTLSYLIATTPRTGSWLLASGLYETGLAGQPEEYFRPDVIREWAAEWRIPRRIPYRDFVRHVLNYGTGANGVFGAKLHRFQYEWLIRTLRNPGNGTEAGLDGQPDFAADSKLLASLIPNPRFVYLVRQDKARQAMSYFRARRDDSWFRTGDGPSELPRRPKASRAAARPLNDREWQHVRLLEDLLVAWDASWRRFFEQSGIEPLEITYEDFIEDFNGTIGTVLEFLDVGMRADAASLNPRILKQGDETSESWAEEYLQRRDSIELEPVQLWQQTRLGALAGRTIRSGRFLARAAIHRITARKPVAGSLRKFQPSDSPGLRRDNG